MIRSVPRVPWGRVRTYKGKFKVGAHAHKPSLLARAWNSCGVVPLNPELIKRYKAGSFKAGKQD